MKLGKTLGEPNRVMLSKESTTFIIPKGRSKVLRAAGRICSVPILAQKMIAGNSQEWINVEYTGNTGPKLERFVRRYPKGKLYAAEVSGDSITSIILFDNDIMIFVRNVFVDNKLYVLTLREEVLVKFLSFNTFMETVSIINENEKYKDIKVFRGGDFLRILDKVADGSIIILPNNEFSISHILGVVSENKRDN